MHPCLSMRIMAAVAVCLAAASPRAVRAQLGVTSVRQPGAPLDVSLRQELDHAVDLASEWLAARQGPDGAWGSETGRLVRTAVALVALTARAERHSDACARAAVWLDCHAPSDGCASADRAWRAVALLSVVPDAAARSNLAARLFAESRAFLPPAAGSEAARPLWDDARRLAGFAPGAAEPSRHERAEFDGLAQHADRLRIPAPYCRWLDVRLINRVGGGRLLRGGEPVDWRRDVAQALINAQRRDPAGGGFWAAADDAVDAPVWRTAFGVLTLLEL